MADDGGTRDLTADNKGEGGKRVTNINGIRHKADACRAESVKKVKKSSLCKKTFFSNITPLTQACELCAQQIIIFFEIP